MGLTCGFLFKFGKFAVITVIYFSVCLVPDLTSVLPHKRPPVLMPFLDYFLFTPEYF